MKTGGFSGGLAKTPSVTLLPARAGDASRRKDILRESQLTFSKGFTASQGKMSLYQKDLDSRLSMPKHTRSRIVNQKLKASLLQLN